MEVALQIREFRPDLRTRMFEAGFEQGELVREVIVERAARHLSLFGNVAQRRSMKSSPGKFIERNQDQVVALLFGHLWRWAPVRLLMLCPSISSLVAQQRRK